MDSEAEREIGQVKWFNPTKGYGFIARPDEKGDIFVHQSEIKCDGFRKLLAEQKVSFSIGESKGKVVATSVAQPDGTTIPETPPARRRRRRGNFKGRRNRRKNEKKTEDGEAVEDKNPQEQADEPAPAPRVEDAAEASDV